MLEFSEAKKDKNLLVAWYLMASYAYYHLDESLIEDHEFDQMARDLLANYDEITHWHKFLITKEDLKAGTLLLAEDDYPLRVKGAAEHLLALKQEKE